MTTEESEPWIIKVPAPEPDILDESAATTLAYELHRWLGGHAARLGQGKSPEEVQAVVMRAMAIVANQYVHLREVANAIEEFRE